MSGLVIVAGEDGDGTARLDAMFDAAPHRGDIRRSASLGRAIFGVAHTAACPYTSIAETDDLLVAVAGRVDNARELAAEWRPSGTDDAAVVAAGFRRLGADAAARLRGACTVAISDGATVWLWRDHLGFSPLFYRADRGRLVAASEAKQVVAGAGMRAEPDVAAIEAVFHHESGDGTGAALRGVSRLPKAATLTIAPDGRAAVDKYWHPDRLVESAHYSSDEASERFRQLFEQAAKRTLYGPDCVSLSGGLDSPTVAAFAAPLHRAIYGTPLAAVSAVYPNHPSVDERPYIELVARHLDMPLSLFEQTRPHLQDLQQWMRLCDGPVPIAALNEIAEQYEQSRQRGYHNVLTGELAEYFIDRRRYLPEHYFTHLRWGALWRFMREAHGYGEPWSRQARLLASAMVPRSARSLADFVRGPLPSPTAPDWVDLDRHRQARAWEKPPLRRRWATSQYDFLEGAGVGLEAAEIVQAWCDVTCRRPFADVDLVEFLISLPAEVKYPEQGRKSWVRSTMRGLLPDELLYRSSVTTFDEATLGRIDYDDLERWIFGTDVRINGVDYSRLHERLDARDLGLWEYLYAKDLAGIHAFLALY